MVNRFEEQFPSLIKCQKKKEVSIGPIGESEDMKGHIYYWNEVISYCLDKQKVKDVINKHLNKHIQIENGVPMAEVFDIILDIKEELKL